MGQPEKADVRSRQSANELRGELNLMRFHTMLRRFTAVPGARAFYHGLRRTAARGHYLKDFWQFRRLSEQKTSRFPLRWTDRAPQLDDRTATTPFDRHYVYHPAWAARVLQQIKPREHVDISSTLHFCTMVSALVPVRFYDYRPADLHLSNLESDRADLTDLPLADGSIESLSCMHVVEHIGLGRYGDALDPDGDAKAMSELLRVLAPGGHLLFVVPVGRPRIHFNAHRIYSYDQICSAFAPLKLKECALVPDDPAAGGLLTDPPQRLFDQQRYGCGCFWFQRNR
jgi:hypothetical protein